MLADPGPPLVLPHRPRTGRRPTDRPRVARRSPAEAKARPILSESLWPPFSLHPVREDTPRADSPRGASPRAGGPGRGWTGGGELVHVREYLDNPQLRRIFLVSDLEDGSAQQQVASVVEQTTRFNFYKITISQGIVIDPRHPDRATVFALVVGPRELESLRDRLRAALKDRVEETTVEPAVVTQLADIGEVEACPPSPAAEMAIPRDAALAFRDADAAGGCRGRGRARGRTAEETRSADPRAGAEPARRAISRPRRGHPDAGRVGSPGGGRRRASAPERTGTGRSGRTLLRRPRLGLAGSPGLTPVPQQAPAGPSPSC